MKVLQRSVLYLFEILIILQCHSLLCHTGPNNRTLLLCVFGTFVIVFLLKRKVEVTKEKVYFILLYVVFMGILFLLGDFRDVEFLFTIFSFFVLCLLYFDTGQCVEEVMEVFTNIMFIISILSLFFFVFASLLEWIQPTAYLSYEEIGWGTQNYYHFGYLYCEGQTIAAFGYEGIRNTGVFVEAPMFVYPLAIAIYYELFLRNKGFRKVFIIVYMITILTSFSTTGLFVMVVVLYLKSYEKLKGTNFFKYVVTPCLVVTVILVLGYIFYDKSVNGFHSVGIRGDDISASIRCFLDNPILGIGYEKMEKLNEYCVIERYQPSLSTGMGAVFAFGGMVLGIWYVIPLVVAVYKYIFYPQKRGEMGLVILTSALFCVTIVHTRVLCTMMNVISWLIITESICFTIPPKVEEEL